MSLKLYYDLLSQPSRALYMFLKAANIPFEAKPVALRKGAHLTEEYKEVNRFQKVPAIDHNGFKLTESVAIIRYLAREFEIPDHWYPKDFKKQARVDEYLEWQHNNTRFHCAMFFQVKWLQPLLSGEPPKERRVQSFEKRMTECLDNIEQLWLDKNEFLAGDEISVADILGVCELEQPRMADYDPRNGRPNINAWMDRVQSIMNPHYDDAHSVVYSIIERNKTKAPWNAKL